ncbi:Uncharacterized protein CGCA056_v013284 [Colletotrichum aenigma]|uniref:Uncharacterized protein n=1 Tax=Colletotrichum aenigma TaxID=1215731 RepID=UPI0018727542|nr:Uncharacterized protein CGCA056_v013284 [Colletotrichum aenigma]KAF5507583.1 Uncharacterized protein CGCA056_v013284 [Colletotrichum aenigma]
MGSLPIIDQVLTPSSLPLPYDPSSVQSTIKSLSLLRHFEGGFFAETDRDKTIVASTFPQTPKNPVTLGMIGGFDRPGFVPTLRTLSSNIFYCLTPSSPVGRFHRNRCRITHSLHSGRGRYVLIHADGSIERFVVGKNIAAGERLQWVVEGGDCKASFILPDGDGEKEASEGLLITEVAVPGFEFCDHDFLTKDTLLSLVGEEKAKQLGWMLLKV